MTNQPGPAHDKPSGPGRLAIVADATCTACGCLCDDINLTVADGKIEAAERACEIGRRWFLADHDQHGLPAATIAGAVAEPDAALDQAAEILRNARSPVVLGLTRTASEGVAAALAVADRIGAVVDIGDAAAAVPALHAVQKIGRVSATLGEVKDRADVVVFWGVDPLVSHPRHWERYSVEPRGRFVPEGWDGRFVIVADQEPTATAERADLYVPVTPETQLSTLWTLRALIGGVDLDPHRVERATGLSIELLRSFAKRLTGARYGAWFYGAGLGRAVGGPACVEAALALVRDLNTRGRFVILPLGEPGNRAGAESVLTWQTGCAGSVDFSADSPRAVCGEDSALALLGRGRVDAALVVADVGAEWLSTAARDQLGRIPTVVIGPRATTAWPTARVALASSTCGIDSGGTVTRVDGVVLPLRPPLAAAVPGERHWLTALAKRLLD
jgi:formylmethanofuran dehydrogenase subunit B